MDRVGTCRLGAFSPPRSGNTFATVGIGNKDEGATDVPATLVLTGLTDSGLEELRKVCEACILMLEGMWRDKGRGLPGAGCWERALAEEIKTKMAAAKGWERKGVDIWVDGLLKVGGGKEEGRARVRVETFELAQNSTPSYGGRHGAAFNSQVTGLAKRVTMVGDHGEVVCVKTVDREGNEKVAKCAIVDTLECAVRGIAAAKEICQVVLNVGGAIVIK